MSGAPADADARDAALFDGAVFCDVVARLRIEPGPLPPEAFEVAERLLHDLAALEERRAEGDDGHAGDPALKRLEAKLDLTLQLLAQALPGLAPLPAKAIRLGPRGVRLAEPAHAAGTDAVLVWQPGEGLPLTLRLPVRALDGGVPSRRWAFPPLPDGLQDALERHVFRLHRRALAAQRRG